MTSARELDLETLPVKDGFRLRGLEMTRIETFTDAAFAFALTLLVIANNDLPKDLQGMRTILRDVPTFIASATLLMVFWQGHNTWSRRFGLDDARTIQLSVALVMTVLVYVYPLRYVASSLFTFLGWVTCVPIGADIPCRTEMATARGAVLEISAQHDVNALFVIYGVGFVAIGLVLVLLNAHALSQRHELRLNAIEEHQTRTEIVGWSVLCAVGVLSVIVALMDSFPGAPGFVYMILSVFMPVYHTKRSRERDRLLAAEVAA